MITSVATSGFGYAASGLGYFTSVNSPTSNSTTERNFVLSQTRPQMNPLNTKVRDSYANN